MNWVEALRMPLYVSSPFDALPSGIECRYDGGRIAVLNLKGTDKVVGFVPTGFDPNHLQELLTRLQS